MLSRRPARKAAEASRAAEKAGNHDEALKQAEMAKSSFEGTLDNGDGMEEELDKSEGAIEKLQEQGADLTDEKFASALSALRDAKTAVEAARSSGVAAAVATQNLPK